MKKTSLLKILVVAIVSVALVLSLGAVVFAEDEYAGWDSNPDLLNNTVDNTVDNSASDMNNVLIDDNTSANEFDNTISTDNTFDNINTSENEGTATTDLNNSESNNDVNSLAYTGIEDNSVLAVAIVLGVLMAIYSFKKVKEYSNV